MSEPSWRSSKRNTLRSMVCSLLSMTPDTEPSSNMA
ncbi:hypothetical protein BMETH_284_0 [methanotrophic bacterial endosymbiont of Bathymodiolus sp.]|nr:hypothetical protein BMETH_284_0 [methanotrophic bacterial endosymbiont of Bathymodiolus sp.]